MEERALGSAVCSCQQSDATAEAAERNGKAQKIIEKNRERARTARNNGRLEMKSSVR